MTPPSSAPSSASASGSAPRREPVADRLEFLTLLLDAVEQAVIATDPEGQVVFWNRFAERLYGWPAKDTVGRKIEELLLWDEAIESGRAAVAGIARGDRHGGEWTLRCRDGSRVLVNSTATLIRDPAGNVVGIVGVSWDISERRRLEDDLQALSRRLLEAQEAERRALARELHDDFGQLLTATRLSLEAARSGVSGAPLRSLAEGVTLIDQALEKVRGIALDLRPAMLDDLGLVAAVRWISRRLARHASFEVRVRDDEVHGALPPPVEVCAFRLVQEALTNVSRHAAAKVVDIELRTADGELRVEVSDDGVGFDPAARRPSGQSARLGLLCMRERVTLVGGRLTIRSQPRTGTTIEARIPIAGPDPP